MREHNKTVEGSIASTRHSSVVRGSSSTALRKSLRRLFPRLSSLSGAAVTRADRGGDALAAAHGATADPGESSGPVAATPATPQVANPNPPEAGHLTDEMIRLNREAAAATGVVAAIHPQDFIYWFCCRHPQQTLEAAISYYFSDGATLGREARRDRHGARLRARPADQAAGVRVGLRLRHASPEEAYTLGCDELRYPLRGDRLPRPADRGQDLAVSAPSGAIRDDRKVRCGLRAFVLLAHAEVLVWPLARAVRIARAPGYLIFTTHGVKSCGAFGITLDDIPADGFLFRANSEQDDLDTVEYGSTLSTPDFVINEIYHQSGTHRQVQASGLVGTSRISG